MWPSRGTSVRSASALLSLRRLVSDVMTSSVGSSRESPLVRRRSKRHNCIRPMTIVVRGPTSTPISARDRAMTLLLLQQNVGVVDIPQVQEHTEVDHIPKCGMSLSLPRFPSLMIVAFFSCIPTYPVPACERTSRSGCEMKGHEVEQSNHHNSINPALVTYVSVYVSTDELKPKQYRY